MKRLIGFLVFATLVVSGVRVDFAYAATIAVDTTNMTNQADGNGVSTECSLPDALAAANTNVAVDGCAAGDPATSAVDTVVIPAGLYDVSQMVTPTLPSVGESTTIQGAGADLTTIVAGSIIATPNSPVLTVLQIENLSLSSSSSVIVFMSSALAAASLNVHHIALNASQLIISHDGTYALTSTLNNIHGTNGASFYVSNQSATNPGDTTISNVTMDGTGGLGSAITHTSNLANDKVYVKDSVITDYKTGIFNAECPLSTISIGSIYVSNSSIGGGNMTIGAQNNCGHLSVDSTTFHDIQGAAIQAQTNYMGVDDIFGIQTCHAVQESSRIELTNNTFTSINVAGINGSPAAVISLDSTLNPSCPLQSLTTNTTVLLQHNTFAGNTLGVFSDLAIMDGTILKNITLQNNALEGSALTGDFSVSGATSATNNITTTAFSGPVFLRSAFRQVASFLLAPLVDNGGKAVIGYNQSGGYPLTLRPQWGSPLIDSAGDVGIETDQRGQARSLLRSYDIGAVEVTRGEVLGDGITAAQLDAYLRTNSPNLAATGINMYGVIGVAFVIITGSCLFLRNRRARLTNSFR